MQIGCMQTTAKFNKVFGRKIIVLLACVIIGHEKTFVFIQIYTFLLYLITSLRIMRIYYNVVQTNNLSTSDFWLI